MSQQRPDRIKQMLHYLWQHRHLSTQQAMELFGYAEATVRRDFQYIANQYPGMIRGHGCLDFDDSTDDKEYVFDVKRTLQSVAKREIAALARTMIKDGDCFFLDSGSTCLELAKTRIIQRSREVILMADHSKFDAVEPHAVATLSCIKTIISDSGLPETIAQRYQRAGCQLFLPHSIK